MIKKKKKNKKTLQQVELDIEPSVITTHEAESAVDNSFFYTNDKIFEQMDSNLIINHILTEYPKLNLKNSDIEIKHEMLKFIQDKIFINILTKQYNITLIDLFKILCKNYISIFKGAFLQKIKTIVDKYEY